LIWLTLYLGLFVWPDDDQSREFPEMSNHVVTGSPSLNPPMSAARILQRMFVKSKSSGGTLGLADELGLVLAEGEIDDDADDEGDWLRLTLELGLSDELGEIDALAEAEGLNEGEVEELGLTLGLALELSLALGEIDADGLGE